MPPLSKKQSVDLFIESSGEIFPKEIYNLILMDEDFPIHKLGTGITKEQLRQRPVSETVKEKLMRSLQSGPRMMQALANHDLFRQLCGNPMSIRILASFHANEMLSNNDLTSLYKKVQEEKEILNGIEEKES